MTTSPVDFPHWALGHGPAHQLDGAPTRLRTERLGTLDLSEGWLVCVDPHSLGAHVEVQVPAGAHEVHVTVADVSDAQDGSHCRNSALSLLLAPLDEVRWSTARLEPMLDEDGDVQAVGVDAGMVGMMGRATLRALQASGDDHEQASVRWVEPGASHPSGVDGFIDDVPGAGRVVAVGSGWGDGGYAVLRALDTDGRLLAVHVDFEVVDGPRPRELEEDDELEEMADDGTPAEPATVGQLTSPMPPALRAVGAVLALALCCLPGVAWWRPFQGRTSLLLAGAALVPALALGIARRVGRRRRGVGEYEDAGAATSMLGLAGAALCGGILLAPVFWPLAVLLHLVAGASAAMVLALMLGRRDGGSIHPPLWMHGLLAIAGSALLHLAAVGRVAWSAELGAWAALLLGQAVLPAWLALGSPKALPEAREHLAERLEPVDGVPAFDAFAWYLEDSGWHRMGVHTLLLALAGALVVMPLSVPWGWIVRPFLLVVVYVVVRGRRRVRAAEASLGGRHPAIQQQVHRIFPGHRVLVIATAVAQALLVLAFPLWLVTPWAASGLCLVAATVWSVTQWWAARAARRAWTAAA